METLLGKHSPVEHPLPENAIKTKDKRQNKTKNEEKVFRISHASKICTEQITKYHFPL